jgi:hypothetical protein
MSGVIDSWEPATLADSLGNVEERDLKVTGSRPNCFDPLLSTPPRRDAVTVG